MDRQLLLKPYCGTNSSLSVLFDFKQKGAISELEDEGQMLEFPTSVGFLNFNKGKVNVGVIRDCFGKITSIGKP